MLNTWCVFIIGSTDDPPRWFTDDIIARQPTEDRVLGRFAALLHNVETDVPDVLLYLRQALALTQAGFTSAASDTGQITQFNSTVEVIPQTEAPRFRVAEDVLETIEFRIVQVVDQTTSVPSLVADSSDRETPANPDVNEKQ